jgi:DNA recombination protein RmuC
VDSISIGILIALIVLVLIVLVLLFRGRRDDFSTKIDAALREQFLNFQASLHNEISITRDEVIRSKDLISLHTIKTIETIKDMGATIHKIIQQQEEAQKLGQSLKDILQAPKLRGSYGEVMLEEMLERVLPKGMWERQYSIAGGQDKVDIVVKLKDVIIPIDAKFPRDDYRRYIEANTPDEKKKYWKAHEEAVKKQIRNIKDKYIRPEKGTTDFALMFIPSEAIYYETIAEKNYMGETSKIYEFAQEKNIIPVSPNTFYAFLQVVIIGIRNVEIVKSAKNLQKGLISLQRSFEFFYKKFEEIGKNLNSAQEAYRVGSNHIEKYKHTLDDTLQLEIFQNDVNVIPDKVNNDH